MYFYIFVLHLCVIQADPLHRIDLIDLDLSKTVNTRRILQGKNVGDTRPYMVYLRPGPSADSKIMETDWLCGGVIIHERYILTSAACIEDVKHFYVVSGTHKWIPPTKATDDECIKYGAKRAVWKCVPKPYIFDGNEYDNIKWMEKDIAVVKVEEAFNFKRRVKGCDFVPQKIDFNDKNTELEKPGTKGSIAGWGSTFSFSDRSAHNSPELLETDVVLISKKNCKRVWDPRYHHIIDQEMVCAKNSLENVDKCSEFDVECKELVYTDEAANYDEETRRVLREDRDKLLIHTAAHFNQTRRQKTTIGGFCENDHGGPLVVGHGKSAVVVGIISACLTKEITQQCYGPFLFTSVWKNRFLINCAIDNEIGATCRRLLRSTNTQMVETTFEWKHLNETQNNGSSRRTFR